MQAQIPQLKFLNLKRLCKFHDQNFLVYSASANSSTRIFKSLKAQTQICKRKLKTVECNCKLIAWGTQTNFATKNLHTWSWKRALQAVVQAQYLQTTNTVPFLVKLHWNWLINALELTEIWLKLGIPIKSIVGCIKNSFWKFWIEEKSSKK